MISVSEGKQSKDMWESGVVVGLNLVKNGFSKLSGIGYFVCNVIYILKIGFPK